MLFAVLLATLALLLELLHAATRGEHAKTLEIMVLRQQLRRYERSAARPPRLSRWDKVVLATIVAKYRALASALVLVKPSPCSAGIVRSCGGNRPTATRRNAAGRRSWPPPPS